MDYAFHRQALYDYEILEKYEAGLALTGAEVKSVKLGRLSLQGAFVILKSNEAWLLNAHISQYQPQNPTAFFEPLRSRKLLLHKREIREISQRLKGKGLTLVPLRVYNKKNKIKLEFGLGRGKKAFDKREAIKKRESKRQIGRELRQKPDAEE